MARLDFFLISDALFPYVTHTKIEPGYRSDHSMNSITVDFDRVKQGRGFWKFNNSLLKDLTFVKKVQDIFKNVTKQYCAEDDYPDEFWENATPEETDFINVNLNPQLFFDILLMEIRGETIKYSTIKKREQFAEQQLLLHETERLEHECHQNPQNDIIFEELSAKKDRLENLFKKESEGAAIRARAKYNIDGEKPSRMFCNLEKHNGVQKFIPSLFVKKK